MALKTQRPPSSFENDDSPIFVVAASNEAPATDPVVSATLETLSQSRGQKPYQSADDHLAVPPRDPMRLRKKPPRDEPKVKSNATAHPIASMQLAFAESVIEVTTGLSTKKPKLRELDAKGRHDALIEQAKNAELLTMAWRYRNGQKEHELVKLMAQISFGVYLLLNGLANSNEQVVDILQGHIDEVDEFLEVAMEDFEYASKDLQARIDHLRLPTENIEVFEKMLEDRSFRAEIVEGNEIIERVLARTDMSLKQYEDDIEKGLESTQQFAIYLAEHNNGAWRKDRPDVIEIHEAMKGNTDGWFNTFKDLQIQGKELNAQITQLAGMVAAMNKKAGEVSRKTWANIPPYTQPPPPSDPSFPSAPRNRRSVSLSIVSSSTHPASSDLPLADPFSPPSQDEDGSETSTPKLQVDTGSTTPEAASDPEEKPNRDEGSEVDSELGSETEDRPDDGPLYILQPRTYTPQPPEPLPSPMVRDPPPLHFHTESAGRQRISLRQRVSLKTNPPESIRIPPREPRDIQRASRQAPDSAYGSDIEQRPRFSDMTASERCPSSHLPVMLPSPRSDQQFYRPVQASPHAPLMQRPQTAGAAVTRGSQTGSGLYSNHVRQPPSRMGGASMLSTVTTMTNEAGRATAGNEKQLKKKKSAFGWLKKAFSLDEEEKAAFEARKNAQVQNKYYSSKSQKYLDGKRIR